MWERTQFVDRPVVQKDADGNTVKVAGKTQYTSVKDVAVNVSPDGTGGGLLRDLVKKTRAAARIQSETGFAEQSEQNTALSNTGILVLNKAQKQGRDLGYVIESLDKRRARKIGKPIAVVDLEGITEVA